MLLRLVNDVVYSMDSDLVKQAFSRYQELVDPILLYVKDQTPQVRVYAIDCLKTIGFRAKPWLAELISSIFSQINRANADILSMKQVPVFMNILVGPNGTQSTNP